LITSDVPLRVHVPKVVNPWSVWIGQTGTAYLTRMSLLKAVKSTVCFCNTIQYCLHPLNKVFNMHLIFFSCVWLGRNKN